MCTNSREHLCLLPFDTVLGYSLSVQLKETNAQYHADCHALYNLQ